MSAKGGSRNIISNLSIFLFSSTLLISDLNNSILSLAERLLIFFSRILVASLFFSIKVIFLAPLDNASNPKDPIPEYKSKIFELFNTTLINLEWAIILKIKRYLAKKI